VIHEANTVLGRVALQENNLDAAKTFLLKSAKTPGSPQLNSYGPSFILARELLEEGEANTVLKYLELVRAFWKSGSSDLSKWEKMIQEGAIPKDRKWQ
jgi:hypothetical protein